MEIRCAQCADLLALDALERAAFDGHGYPKFFFRQAIDCWPEKLLVACSAGQLVGYALWAHADSDDAWLLSLAVAESWRGQGVAQALVRQVLQAATGCRQLLLTVDPENISAVMLYQRLGFHSIRSEAGYFGAAGARSVYAHTLPFEC